MRIATRVTSPLVVLISWVAAVAAAGSALAMAVVGQGLGAVLGGCSWIGAATPLDHPVWALVNQPVLNFASTPAATGYWLGSTVFPLVAALLLLGPRGRRPTLVGRLFRIQIAWWAALVGGVWLPLLDPVDGHLARYLLLHRLPPALVWAAMACATVVAVLASGNLVQIARTLHPHIRRWLRVAIVGIHFGVPVAGWLMMIFVVAGAPPLPSAVGLGVTVAAAAVVAWIHDPPPLPRSLAPPSVPAGGAVAVAAAVAIVAVWVAGRPLPDGRTAAVVWGKPGTFNNIRPWIDVSSSRLSEPGSKRVPGRVGVSGGPSEHAILCPQNVTAIADAAVTNKELTHGRKG